MRISRTGTAAAVLLTLLAVMIHGSPGANAAPAGTPHLPDLQSLIPLDQMSIATDDTGRVFRYTHVVANLGDGPLEIQPTYDPATDTAIGVQRIYSHSANGTWSVMDQRQIVGRFIYHAVHGHYHYPLAEFGLYGVKADGSIGAPVTMSPKIGFCIADSAEFDGTLPHVGEFSYSGGACADPRSTLGISVGWGDVYDHNDAGQSIPAAGLADGSYWFRSVVDPDNYLLEKNETNNITDIKVQVANNVVTVLSQPQHPSSAPPSVSLDAPAGGAVSGTITLRASAGDTSGITGVQFLLDGDPLGPPDTTAPYELAWDTSTVLDGGHTLAAKATNGRGIRSTTSARQVAVSNTGGGRAVLAVDATRSVDGRGAVTTPAMNTATPGEMLAAFVSSDGPSNGPQTATVSGAGLTWTLAKRANAQAGTSEVWTAKATTALTNAQITSTPAASGFDQSLSVVAFTGAAGIGATAAKSATTGAPSVSLTTTVDGSWVHGAGNDWDGAVARAPAAGQDLLHQFVDSPVGDTFWAQRTTSVTRGTGVAVALADTAPTNHRWNLAAVEITPATPPAPGPRISDVVVLDRTSSSARVTWTTDVPATTQVQYGPTSSYGFTTPLVSTPTTTHSAPISGLAPETTYHYRVVSSDGAGVTTRSPDFVFTTAGVSTISCHMTAPAAGSTVSGTITVSADASSTASVSGVQFKADSANLGAEDTSPPYAVTWDTRTVPNGTHTLSAVARDPTGNRATAAPITVTVSNAAPSHPPGRVASYGFDEGSGGFANDRSGSGNRGTVSGPAWTTAGKVGGALTFDGVNDLVTVPDTPSLHLTTGMTIDAWIRPTVASTWSTVALKERPNGLAYSLYGANDQSRAAGYINNGADRLAAATTATPANAWTHVAVTYDGANLRLYVNGALVRTSAVTGPIAASTGALRIGGNTVWGEWFTGTIDELNIYNRALSAAEITQDMAGG